MAWAKFTDKLHENDKVGAVSDAAFRLWVLSITWSNDKLTDGHVPTSRPVRLLILRNAKKTIAELIAAKLWHQAAHPCTSCLAQRAAKKVLDPIPSGGYLIHHYFDFQKPAWVIRQEREHLRSIASKGGAASVEARAQMVLGGEVAQPLRSSAAVDGPDDEVNRYGQAQRSTGAVQRGLPRIASPPTNNDGLPDAWQPARPLRSTATVKRGAQPLRSTPVPPYPRTPVPGSVSSTRTSLQRDPEPVDEPEDAPAGPPRPARPRATGSVDPGVRREAPKGTGMRHINQSLGGTR